MEDYSKVEAEAHETPANEDSSSSDSDEEEKVVSESVGISEPDAAAELDATESETTRDSEVVLTDVGPKQTTLLPPDDDSTVDGVVVGFDNNAGNSSSFPEPALEQNVEDSSRPATVPSLRPEMAAAMVVVKLKQASPILTKPWKLSRFLLFVTVWCMRFLGGVAVDFSKFFDGAPIDESEHSPATHA
ncbi:uncharacterized protein LOC120132513 [Hibiscus syriacus]|uniref:uncharacterized protein LOC120132513 n=1 Tax=Hibiscus syriacus TaxID=106335 RepID=UPI001924A112|nr:uncharacterized protein LOC120132513 [Hibiscus syriacus]